MPSSEIMVEALHVSKKFCKDLRRSFWYGAQDIAAELALWRAAGSGQCPQPKLRSGEFWALNDISFTLERGQALGILGPNGAGKSTLLKLLNGLIKPDVGRITLRGRVAPMIELGAGFSPILTGRENIYINAAVLGLSRQQTDRVVDEVIDFAGLEQFIDTPMQHYSSGMWVRLGFAIAAQLKPDVLLVDEVLAVGDLNFRRKCVQHMFNYLQNGGALLLVSHDLYTLQSICPTSLLIVQGNVRFQGDTIQAVHRYLAIESTRPAAHVDQDLRGVRSDTAGVIIERVEIVPLQDGALRTGEAARVILHYRSCEAVGAAHWGFMFWTVDMSVCIAAALPDTPNGSIEPGAGRFSCVLPRLPLHAGNYALRATLSDRHKTPLALLGWQDPPLFFEVAANITRENNSRSALGALVTLEADWETHPERSDRL